jgi:preprotein translocase subunit SecE
MTDTDAAPKASGGSHKGVFARLALFIRQVVAELRKVIWPTRKELISYTTVVVFFVVLMAAIIALFDFVFTEGVLAIFG